MDSIKPPALSPPPLGPLTAERHVEIAQAFSNGSEQLKKCAQHIQAQIRSAQKTLVQLKEHIESAEEGSTHHTQQALVQELMILTEMAQHKAKDSCEFQTAVHFHEVDLAATRKFNAARAQWNTGECFSLVPEPSNPVDPHAVMIFSGPQKIGYVAKNCAQKLHQFIQQGWTITGPAFLVRKDGGHWNEGRISVRLESSLMGWRGYNPTAPLEQNMARMQQALLNTKIAEPVIDPPHKLRPKSL